MREMMIIDQAMNAWYHEDYETCNEVSFKVNYINDEYDDCEFFDSLEEAEDFAEDMIAQGYEVEIKRAA